ncbi:class I SAM-dependent methyltransferase [Herbaspirillum lusitanum]|uniref:Class I SAM-dependent methyltransferase n=1 Tax=Herbaspirillum lusitanum TaxID=213312 RepID=A0ABW9AD70_9BURK
MNDHAVPPLPSALTGALPGVGESAERAELAARYASLASVPSTLRIPLAARALGEALFPSLRLNDRYAAGTLAALGDDGRRWLSDKHSVYGSMARTRRFRALAQAFLQRHPEGHVVNLGCGLSDYLQWLDNGSSHMIDADLPEVIALRRTLLPPRNPRHRLRELDLNGTGWWNALALPDADDAQDSVRPVFLFSEGVSMYLKPDVIRQVLHTFGERAPAGSVLAFDAMCWLAAGRARRHPSVRYTSAQFHWGVRRVRELTQPHPRLQLITNYRVMESYGFPYSLIGPLFRSLIGVPFYAVYLLGADVGLRDTRSYKEVKA